MINLVMQMIDTNEANINVTITLCDQGDAYIIANGTITVTEPNKDDITRNQLLKIIHYLLTVFQKLIIHLLIMQKIQTS